MSRRLMIGGGITAAVALVAAAVALMVTYDGGLADAHARWESERPDRYTMTVDCGACPGSTWHVTVHGDEVIAMEPASQPLTDLLQGYLEKNPLTIDRLYEGARNGASDRLLARVELDVDANGVPYHVSVGPPITNDTYHEFGWTILEFRERG